MGTSQRSVHHREFAVLLVVFLACFVSGQAFGQVLFEDDFDGDAIDATKWRLDDAPFETGAGDFSTLVADGRVRISGTATKNWWGGLALATVPTFTASKDSPLTFEVDRLAHQRVDNTATGAGANSSTRTSVWITDINRENYVLFSQNTNEGGWTYNKRVGEPDDNATAGGANIFEFDGLDADLGVHTMGMVADGETVQLFLDDIEGPTVSFPFSEDIVFEFGAYARRGEGAQPTDMVTGFFDNVLISGAAEECVGLSPPFTEVLPEDDPPVLTLQIPRDAPRPATVTVTSSAKEVAVAVGAADGVLEIVFGDGDPPAVVLPVELTGKGLAEFTVTNGFGACTGDPIQIFVSEVLVQDDFEDAEFNDNLWIDDDEPFEDGSGEFELVEAGGVLRISGTAAEFGWPGLAAMSLDTFNPEPRRPVRFQIDQTLLGTSIGAFRAGVWVVDCDRTDFVFFSFNKGAGDWVANSTTAALWPPIGDGTDLAAYNCCGFADLGITRRVELVANGETVAVIMDGVKGGEVEFAVDEVVFGFGAYASGPGDAVEATFDNARILGDASTLGEGCEGDRTGTKFRRGDTDASGVVDISDPIFNLTFQFVGGIDDLPCEDAADVDNSGVIDISDPIYNLTFQFVGGVAAPPAPGPTGCGPDPVDPGDDLGCASYPIEKC